MFRNDGNNLTITIYTQIQDHIYPSSSGITLFGFVLNYLQIYEGMA
jgi:hypothetical protein